VLNKVDLLTKDELSGLRARLLAALSWSGPVYEISALKGEGTRKLTGELMNRLEALDRDESTPENETGPE